VFAVYIYFTKHTDEEVCQKAITGLGRARSSHFLHGLGGWVGWNLNPIIIVRILT